jgi:hypothetical protein
MGEAFMAKHSDADTNRLRRWMQASAALWLICSPPALEAQGQIADGILLSLPGGCEVRSGDKVQRRLLALKEPNVRPDDRIRCAMSGVLRLRLPGNGAIVAVEFNDPEFEYVVPIGAQYPSLPPSQTPGRGSSLFPAHPLSEPPRTRLAEERSSTGGASAQLSQLERCESPIGTLAVVEPQSQALAGLSRYGLQSPVGLIRAIARQSNCFQIVERGVGMQNMVQERALAEVGEMKSGQYSGKGQMVAADFILTPSVLFSENKAGGFDGAIGGLMGRPGGAGAP